MIHNYYSCDKILAVIKEMIKNVQLIHSLFSTQTMFQYIPDNTLLSLFLFAIFNCVVGNIYRLF